MKYLHAMVRVRDLEASMKFYRDALGLVETRRKDFPQGRFTLVYLAAPENPDSEIELTYNHDDEDYGGARNFGHLAFAVDNIYETCDRLRQHGVTINRRHGTAAWRLSVPRITYRLNCFRKTRRLRPRSHGVRCRIPVLGSRPCRCRVFGSKLPAYLTGRDTL